MKKLLLLKLMLLSATFGFAQCDLVSVMTSSKTEYLNASFALERSVDENSSIEVGKTQVIIAPGSGEPMTGTIKAVTCQWTSPYQEGKSVIKAEFINPERGTMHATITIQGTAGKLTFLMEIEEMPERKIRVNLDSFKEKS